MKRTIAQHNSLLCRLISFCIYINGGQGVLTACSLIQSEQFDKGWDVLSKTYIEKIMIAEIINGTNLTDEQIIVLTIALDKLFL